jgi:hypothetical protein
LLVGAGSGAAEGSVEAPAPAGSVVASRIRLTMLAMTI